MQLHRKQTSHFAKFKHESYHFCYSYFLVFQSNKANDDFLIKYSRFDTAILLKLPHGFQTENRLIRMYKILPHLVTWKLQCDTEEKKPG